MTKLASTKPLALAVLSILLTTGTLQANEYQSSCYIYQFFPSLPYVQNQSCSLSIGVQYNHSPLGWNGTINWGDGSTDITGGSTFDIYNHTYLNPGAYTISCNGVAGEYYYSGFFNSVYNHGTNAIAASANVTVLPAPPSFTVSPTNQVLFPGSNAVFTATVVSSVPVLLQWLQNGTNIANATNSSLTISNVQVASEASYSLYATNSGGTNVSSSALLVVRRPLKIIFGGFSPTNTFRLTVANADNSAINPLRVPTIGILTKTNLNSAVNWQPLGVSPTPNNGILQFESPVMSPARNFYRTIETQ